MTSVAFAAVLQAAVLSTGAQSYADAHQENVDTGRPLVVLVGAEWCPACRQMKNNIMPEVARRGLLKKVAFAEVNTDEERTLSRKLMSGGGIPQLVMYRKTSEGWEREVLVGAQSPERIESFINDGLDGLEAPAAALTNN